MQAMESDAYPEFEYMNMSNGDLLCSQTPSFDPTTFMTRTVTATSWNTEYTDDSGYGSNNQSMFMTSYGDASDNYQAMSMDDFSSPSQLYGADQVYQIDISGTGSQYGEQSTPRTGFQQPEFVTPAAVEHLPDADFDTALWNAGFADQHPSFSNMPYHADMSLPPAALDIVPLSSPSAPMQLPPSPSSIRGATSSTKRTAKGSSGRPGKFPCLACKVKPFGRAADLDRHTKMVHFRDANKGYLCDYRRCPRATEPFFRQDHFRDHLREFHKEDLPKRGNHSTTHHHTSKHQGDPEYSAGWWASRATRAVFDGWWRCSRCLCRVPASQGGNWACDGCGTRCEPERQLVRAPGFAGCDYGCSIYGTSTAALREHLAYAHGEDVPLGKGDNELDDDAWWRERDPDAVYGGWWRCGRCLERVQLDHNRFECGRCGGACEEERVHVRRDAGL